MSSKNDPSPLPFEEKIKLLDEDEKTRTGDLIDRLLAERHEKQQPSMPDNGENLNAKRR
jgi:hypothetical protein